MCSHARHRISPAANPLLPKRLHGFALLHNQHPTGAVHTNAHRQEPVPVGRMSPVYPVGVADSRCRFAEEWDLAVADPSFTVGGTDAT